MLLVKTEVKPSSIQGLGLFAKEDIPKGTKIWEYHWLDQEFSIDDIKSLIENSLNKDFVLKYSFKEGDKYILCSDDAKYMNHSKECNCDEQGLYTITNRNIKAGEELTCDYSTFDDDFDENEFDK